MRLTAEENKTRVQFVTQLFKFNPKLSVRKAQELIVSNLGKQMRPGKILEIRRSVVESDANKVTQ